MRSLKVPSFLPIFLLVMWIGTLSYAAESITASAATNKDSNSTDANYSNLVPLQQDPPPVCSVLEVRHGGFRVAEITSDTIYTRKNSTKSNPSMKRQEREKPREQRDKGRRQDKDEIKSDKDLKRPKRSSAVANTTVTTDSKRETRESTVQKANIITECTAPLVSNVYDFYWYQIFLDNGGPPGKVNATKLKPNTTLVSFPCNRPIAFTSPNGADLFYTYELIEFEKVYRHEQGFLRFSQTPAEFVDVIGQLVWRPPGMQRRYYHLSYRKDDTGFYMNVEGNRKCVFEEKPLRINCLEDVACICEGDGTENCYELNTGAAGFGISPALTASLIGR